MNTNKTNQWHKTLGLWLILSLSTVLTLSAKTNIMFLGDSITSGSGPLPTAFDANISTYDGGLIEFKDQQGYRVELWNLIKDDNVIDTAEIDFVGTMTKTASETSAPEGFDEDHEGHAGFSSYDILHGKKVPNATPPMRAGMDNILLKSNPDVILIHIGTNDGATLIPIGNHLDSNKDKNTTVNNVRKILNKVFKKNPNTKVLLARIIEARRAHNFPSEGTLPKNTWNTKILNDEITKMVNNYSAKYKNSIRMVDMEKGASIKYSPCGTKLGDMLPFHKDDNSYDYHPNKKGYKKMAQKWFDELKATKWLEKDTEKPLITLMGASSVQLEINAIYSEYNATVTDNYDTDIEVTIDDSNISESIEGNYTVTYDATDSAGNKAVQVKRTVVVVATNVPDTTDPVITLNGEANITILQGSSYKDAGATALDNKDGKITPTVQGLPDTTKPRSYTITYTAKDEAKNEASVTRNVTVTLNNDQNQNNIEDNLEKDWFNYDKPTQTATITPTGSVEDTVLKGAKEILVLPKVDTTSIVLEHVFNNARTTAYIKSDENGNVNSGFKSATSDDVTVSSPISLPLGTTAEIKKEANAVSIKIKTKLNTNESIIIGGK
jgi:lysophospholipase L1-like esterase